MSRQLTPNERRWLNLISYAEGTWGAQGPRYNITFGYTPISDLSRHPDRVVRSGGHASAAAGAYQFMPGTWSGAAKALGLKDFGPASQDLAALYLMRRRGVDPAKDPINPQTISRLSGEWAALPTLRGGSYYPNQRAKSYEQLYNFAKKQGAQLPSSRDWTGVSTGGGDSTQSSSSSGSSAEQRLERDIVVSMLGNLASELLSDADKPVDPSKLNAPSRMPAVSSADEEEDDQLIAAVVNRLGAIEQKLDETGSSQLFDPGVLTNVGNIRQSMADLMAQAQRAFNPANVRSVIRRYN